MIFKIFSARSTYRSAHSLIYKVLKMSTLYDVKQKKKNEHFNINIYFSNKNENYL